MRLEGKVAFISGGARGMEASETRLFAREGAGSRDRRSLGGCDCDYGDWYHRESQ